jgi:hypothetical protein
MFARSAAPDTLQGKAMQAVNVKWGEDFLERAGRESIGVPVCKKKYAPFHFPVVRKRNGRFVVTVERMFACSCHHPLRKAVIEQHGLRDGWEPFGQWSLQKATEMARREILKLNCDAGTTAASDGETTEDDSSSLGGSFCMLDGTCPVEPRTRLTDLCSNGKCSWKVKSAFDDVSCPPR